MGRLNLGKKNKLVDTRTLQFADYVSMVETPIEHLVEEIEAFFTKSSVLPAAPGSLNDEEGITNWTMMDNDTVGDCTCAAAGHLIMAWTAMAKAPVIPSADQILAAYEAISGYNPANPQSDVGAACLSVLNYWKKNGIAGNNIGAFAEINVENSGYIKDALYIFNGVYIGLQLPLSAESQYAGGQPWSVTSGKNSRAGSWGGHCVPIVAYDANYLYCVTWGSIQKMTWGFFDEYCDEAYCIIDPAYLASGKTIEGFNLAQLQADLKAI